MNARAQRAVLAAMSIACALVACSSDAGNTLPGTLERNRIELVADANESIVSIAVSEGANVQAGDVILVQDRALSAAEIESGRALLAEAEARVAELRSGPRATTIRAAAARRDRARAERDDAQRERERLTELAARNLVSRAELDRQVAATNGAEASLREAEAALRELEEGTRSEQLAQARDAANSARAHLSGLETTSARLEIRAPVAGYVDALPYHVGEKPIRGATVAVLLAAGPPFARIHVPAPLRPRVKVGGAARIVLDGDPREYRGQVRFVSSTAEFTPYYSLTQADRSRLSYLAEVVLEEPEALTLPAGVPVNVHLELAATP